MLTGLTAWRKRKEFLRDNTPLAWGLRSAASIEDQLGKDFRPPRIELHGNDCVIPHDGRNLARHGLCMLLMVYNWLIFQEGKPINHGANYQWPGKPSPTTAIDLVGTYERLRKSLVERPDDGRLDKALSYWVLPTDRRFPIAFLDRPLRELLSQPFDELMSTPGVGHKKILGFFDLLEAGLEGHDARCAVRPRQPGRREAAESSRRRPAASMPRSFPNRSGRNGAKRCIATAWDRKSWAASRRRCKSLPTVIWHSRLEEYADRSLADIRSLKTHGEKRVHAILEVFCTVHEALATATLQENIDVVLVPRFVPPLTRWLMETVGAARSAARR